MDILIRSAIESDLPVLKSFEQGIIEAERPYDHTLKTDPISYYDLGELVLSPDAEVVVAEIAGEPVASGYVQKRRSLDYVKSDYHAFLGFMFVVPAFRGKGINGQLLAHLFDWARANDLPDIHLTVYPGNVAAIRAYEKVKFAPHILEMRMNLDE